LLLWFISFDVERYARLISFLSCVLVVQGIAIVGIDLAAGMPGWWTTFEGPCCSGLGAILLMLQRTGSGGRNQESGKNMRSADP